MLELLQGRGAHSSRCSAHLPKPGVHAAHLGRGTYIDVVNVQDAGVELEAQRLGLLDRAGQLAIGLQQEARMPA